VVGPRENPISPAAFQRQGLLPKPTRTHYAFSSSPFFPHLIERCKNFCFSKAHISARLSQEGTTEVNE